MSPGAQLWLLLFITLLFAVLLFGALKVRRLGRMPLYVPAFCCFCGGVLIALLARLHGSLNGVLTLGPFQGMMPRTIHYETLILPAQLVTAVLLVVVLIGWLRGSGRPRR